MRGRFAKKVMIKESAGTCQKIVHAASLIHSPRIMSDAEIENTVLAL